MSQNRDRAKAAAALSDEIRPLLHGHDPDIQGAVIADLVAIWLHGHKGPDRDKVREDLMFKHEETALELVAMYDAREEAEANGGVA